MSDKRKIVIIVGETTQQQLRDALEEDAKKSEHLIIKSRESDIENAKILQEAKSLKPHRGKHRTPQNKYI